MEELKIKNIGITNFAKRHFSEKTTVTKILNVSIEDFLKHLQDYDLDNFSNIFVQIRKGDFEFSRLLTIPNLTDARLNILKLDASNIQYLRSDYVTRTESELPVLTRWLDLPPPIQLPTAKFLTIVFYSNEQLMKENEHMIYEEIIDYKWGIVSIMAHDHEGVSPMPPITMFRNSLGLDQGGNGEPLNLEKYKQSVEFWKHYALVKST